MKKIILLLSLFFSLVAAAQPTGVTISNLPTYIGNPSGGYVPVVILGATRKVDAKLFGFKSFDSLHVNYGAAIDTFVFYNRSSGVIFTSLYQHAVVDSNLYTTRYYASQNFYPLNNPSGFITSGSTSTLTNKSGNISQWTNDALYLTAINSSMIATALGYTPYNVLGGNLTGAAGMGYLGLPVQSSSPIAQTNITEVYRDSAGGIAFRYPTGFVNALRALSAHTANISYYFPDSSGTFALTNYTQQQLNGKGYVNFSGTAPSFLTPAQVTANLLPFTSSNQGLVPPPVTVTGKVLQDDQAWHVPANAGIVSVNTTIGPGYIDSTQAGVTFYDSSTWNNIGGKLESSGPTVVGNHISFTEADNSHTQYVRLVQPTCLDQQNLRVDYRITSLNAATDSGCQLNLETLTGLAATSTLKAQFNVVTKKMELIYFNGAASILTSGTAIPTVSQGDSMTITLVNNYQTLTATATNRTTGFSSSVSFTNTFTSGQPIFVSNTAKVTFRAGNGTYVLDRFVYSSSLPQNATLMTVGYSITQGFYAGSIAGAGARQIGSIVSAGSGDYTASVVPRVSELMAFHPHNILIGGLAGNSILDGESTGQWQAELLGIYDTLTVHGYPVYFTLETPRNATDITPANTYMNATFPGKTIDTYTPLATGSNLNAAYSVDGTHYNLLGHTAWANTVKNSSIYATIFAGPVATNQYLNHPNFNTGSDLKLPDVRYVRDYVKAGVSYPVNSFLYTDPTTGLPTTSPFISIDSVHKYMTLRNDIAGGGPVYVVSNQNNGSFSLCGFEMLNTTGTTIISNGASLFYYSPATGQPFSGNVYLNNTQQGILFGSANTIRGALSPSGNLVFNGSFASSIPDNGSKLQISSISVGYTAQTANYAVLASDHIINCTANSFTVTLPTAVGITGREYIIKNTGSSTTITVATTSSQTIDGSAPGTVTTLVPLRVVSNGANWITF